MAKKTYVKPEIKYVTKGEAVKKWPELAVEYGGGELDMENSAAEQERFWSTDVFVHFTSYENRIACGKVEFPYLEQVADFQGLDHLLLMIEGMMDFVNSKNKDAHYPQSSFEKRSIVLKKQPANPNLYDFKGSIPVPHVANPIPRFTGKRIAFAAISIRYRQHASMQGMLRIAGSDTPFRSGIELIRLLHQSLTTTQDSQSD